MSKMYEISDDKSHIVNINAINSIQLFNNIFINVLGDIFFAAFDYGCINFLND
jgi:hypothetical protein